MSGTNYTVAIYSGNIPSTTFIENLIEGMSESGLRILLFGKKLKQVSYKGNVQVIATPQSELLLIFFVIKEAVKLHSKNRNKLSKLFASVKTRNKSFRYFVKDLGAILPILNAAPDIFHIQWAKTLQVYPELMQLLDCKIAVSLRGAHINYSPLNDPELAEAYRTYFPEVDAFHAVSDAISSEAQKYGADSNKISVIHSSVRESLLTGDVHPCNTRTKLEIISVGRFHWKKGYHYGLDTMKMLKESKTGFHYSIVAQGDIPEEITFLINEYELSNEVTIIPGLQYEALIDKLKSSHVLLLPSVEEGIANVVLEAMAVGVPVITTDCGGMNEVVADEHNGFIVRVRNPEAVAQKISALLDKSENELSMMISNAREKIRKEFSRKGQIEQFISFYNKLAAE
jgi:glycosyltransferase involved in cell wall biosynthesis